MFAGLVLIPLLVAAGASLSWASVSRGLADDGVPRTSRFSSLVARSGAPAPVSVGTSFALDRGRGGAAVPVFPALIGAVVGVLGVVAALTFSAGVSDAAAHPERFGQVAQLQAFFGVNGEDFVPTDEVLAVMVEDPDVIAVNDARQGVVESGTVDIPLFALDPVADPPPIVVTRGTLPQADDELTLAPGSADSLGVDVGDTIDLAGSGGAGPYRVSGIAFVPEGSHNDYDVGAWVGRDTFEQLVDERRPTDRTAPPGVGRPPATIAAPAAADRGSWDRPTDRSASPAC
jgi:hypothetical protein